MSADSEPNGLGEGASSGEREPVPEFVVPPPIDDDADAATIDREFARIIAGWDLDGEAAGEAGPWPAAEDRSSTDAAPSRPRTGTGTGTGDDGLSGTGPQIVHEPRDTPLPQRPQIWRGFDEPPAGRSASPGLDDEAGFEALNERYEPPEPPPVGGDFVSRLSWAAVLGGPLFLVFAVLFWEGMPHLFMLAALAAFVGGFVALVARMPRDRDPDDGDDGAVV